jgi:uncharacterized protein (TIGR04551 family)
VKRAAANSMPQSHVSRGIASQLINRTDRVILTHRRHSLFGLATGMLMGMSLMLSSAAWAQAPVVEDDGQLDAAEKAASAAAKAAEQKAAKKPAPTKQSKQKAPKPKPTKGKLGFDGMPSWDDANKKSVAQDSPGHELTANWDAAMGPAARVSFPWVEHHGVFRVRSDLFYGFDLGTYDASSRQGSSPFAPPLTARDQLGNQHPENVDHRYNQDADSLAGANIRFRYNPTLHVSESLRIRTTIDILDNLVLGSTPDGGPHTQRSLGPDADILGRADVPVEAFEDSQRPPESGVNGWRDSMRVKRLWGEWQTPLGLLTMGRMPSHWGLGMIAHSGDCLDCDFGDSVDRIMGVTKLFDTYLSFAWDFPAEGAIGASGTQDLRNQPNGQPYDLDQRDDGNQFIFAIFRRPHSRAELQKRTKELHQDRVHTFDWGLYNIIRTQSLEATYPSDGIPPLNDRGVQLYEVDAFTFTPDLWLDFQYRPTKKSAYRLQLEAALTTGSIEEVPQLFHEAREGCVDPTETDIEVCESTEPRRRDILRFGYALEFDVTVGDIDWGLHHGLATGDAQGTFGRLGSSELPSAAPVGSKDESLTSFYFDRDYNVDLIMFRELLGGVSNATYFRPYLRYNVINQPTETWGFEIAAIYGYALEKEATPGQENGLGLEFDLEFFMTQKDRFRWSLAYGALFPMGAFNTLNPDGTLKSEANTAQTLQMLFGIEF